MNVQFPGSIGSDYGIGSGRGEQVERPNVEQSEQHNAQRRNLEPDTFTSSAVRPDGSDPALWEVLSEAEQSYFANLAAVGNLTYGPGAVHQTGPALGLNLDVRA